MKIAFDKIVDIGDIVVVGDPYHSSVGVIHRIKPRGAKAFEKRGMVPLFTLFTSDYYDCFSMHCVSIQTSRWNSTAMTYDILDPPEIVVRNQTVRNICRAVQIPTSAVPLMFLPLITNKLIELQDTFYNL